MLDKWLKDNVPEQTRPKLLEKIILEFKPTGINPMPLIPHIKDYLVDRVSFESRSKEAASRILGAISKFGHYHVKAAEEYIGPLGWEVVRLNGNWTSICESCTSSKEATLRAQWRDLAKSILERRAEGKNYPPRLDSGLQGEIKALVGDLGNKLSIGKN